MEYDKCKGVILQCSPLLGKYLWFQPRIHEWQDSLVSKMCIWVRHKPLTPSYESERMQISEYLTLDLWICYRCLSFCLPASDLLMEWKFEVCDSPQSGPYKIILPGIYSTWVFSEELKCYACLAVRIVLLCKHVPSRYLPLYLVHMAILIVISFSSSVFFSDAISLERDRGMCSSDF